MGRLSFAARDYRVANGRWPSLEELRVQRPSLPSRDRWQGEFAFTVVDDALTVTCAGPDGALGTGDDVGRATITPDP